ncbi:hypothetical protein NLX86_29190 [Streptomyces sp. A3M-1-3]|uniref:hypothetical protein n=1 Tax=Streptomyces sp. A3M-1-3 TaxID=2962044 RepID=UPI0020B8B207|nr:hypothetical protein [Streptomyces sp. A3M-1-3]MCP3822012.1 hypothetical protein [Streptomyces sp. A3M-1-3]
MGIESDQLVYDYLSRVGDLAQQRQLPSGDRMRLVSTLRGEIDKQRATQTADTPAAVRRILGRLGSPEDIVVAAAADGAAPTPVPPPEPVPRPRRAQPPEPEVSSTAASPPHLAGEDELGPQGSEPDWWRIEPGPYGLGDAVPGFVGGVEIPEILRPPTAPEAPEDGAEAPEPPPGTRRRRSRGRGAGAGAGAGAARRAGADIGTSNGDGAAGAARRSADADADVDADVAGGGTAGTRRRWWRRRLRRRTAPAPPAAPTAPSAAQRAPLANPLLLLAAALLVGGAVLGSWLALGAGWLLVYASRTMSRAEAKWVTLGLPGLVAVGGIVWLWGRSEGRWGEPLAQGALGEAFSGVWPVVVRTAAVASALYLVWRARRR